MVSTLARFVKGILCSASDMAHASRAALKSLYGVSLYRNAVYLIISAIALGLTGFFFWIAAARLYTPEEVGLASAAISAMLLLSEVSMLGLDYAVVKYLPGAGSRATGIINSSLTVAGATSIALSAVFIAGVGLWSPALHSVREQLPFALAFVAFTLATNLHSMAQRVCTARRRSGFAMAMGLIYAFVRFVPLLAMAAYASSLGIFASFGFALCLSAAAGIILFVPKAEAGYRPSLAVKMDLLVPMVRFALGNFVANLAMTATGFVLPLVVINVLGSEQNAYFYVAWTLVSVLFAVLTAININLFAEGSHLPYELKDYVKKSLKFSMAIVAASVVLALLLGRRCLLAFGEDYAANATHMLWLLALSAFPVAINYVYISVLRVRGQTGWIVAVSLFVAVVTLGSSPYMLSRMGLPGIGVLWLASQGVVALFAAWQIWRILRGVQVETTGAAR